MNTNTKELKRYLKVLLASLFFMLICSEAIQAQNILSKRVSIDFKNSTIENVLKYLQSTYNVHFSYTRSLINVDEKITVHLENFALNKVLDIIFANQNVMYIQKSKLIVLQPKPQNMDKLIIKGQICDEDHQPIEFAAILFKASGNGLITDGNGNFRTILKKKDLTDTLIISSLGFEKKRIAIEGLSSTSSFRIVLKKKPVNLPEITILRKKYKNKTWGNDGLFSIGSMYIDTHGQQTVLYIENEDSMKGKIVSVNFYLSRKGNTKAPFRVRLYEKDTLSGKPGKDLLSEMIVAKPNSKSGWFKMDLTEFDIQIPEQGFFAGIEGLYPGNQQGKNSDIEELSDEEVSFSEAPKTISYGQQLGYTRMKGTNTWHYSLANTWFQLDKNNYNLMISVDLKVAKN